MEKDDYESRISVIESNIKKLVVTERDIWVSIEEMRRCILSVKDGLSNKLDERYAKADADTKSILRWGITGVVGWLLSITTFLFSKLMGWV